MGKLPLMKSLITSLLVLIFSTMLTAQELPPVVNFEPSVYAGGNQNWMIDESSNNVIYFANNKGLLEFNGAQWRLFPTPNGSIMRSVKVVNDRIYTGCYMDFGYWEKTTNGSLSYKSIVDLSDIKIEEDEQFWNIMYSDQYVLFQSLSSIYTYNIATGSVEKIISHFRINKSFQTKGDFYYQVLGEGLFQIRKRDAVLISDNNVFKEQGVVTVFNDNNQLSVVTADLRRFLIDEEGSIKELGTALPDTIKAYSATRLSDQGLVIGSIAQGLWAYNKIGDFDFNINQRLGLLNNTVLSVFEDSQKNIWLGLDNGISVVNRTSPFSLFTDRFGELGTVYTTEKKEDYLYLGTNQGLYVKSKESDEFEFVKGTKGQVWSLKTIDDVLYCAHDAGVFVIDKNRATPVYQSSGAWEVHKVPHLTNRLLIGSYNGLHLLDDSGSKVEYLQPLDGFDISSKDVAVSRSRIYINHEYKGVYELEVNEDFTKIISVIPIESLKKGVGSDLIGFESDVLYAKRDSVFIKDSNSHLFTYHKQLSELLIKFGSYTSATLQTTKDGYLWMFSTEGLTKISKNDLDGSYTSQFIPLEKELRKEKLGYENVTWLGDESYVIGSSIGYTIYDETKSISPNHEIYLNSIRKKNNGSMLPVPFDEKYRVAYDENEIKLTYFIPCYQKYANVEYQYRIKEIDNDWRPWSKKQSITLKGLAHGDYLIEIRGRVDGKLSANLLSIPLSIAPPYYLSATAIVCYILIVILVVGLLNAFYLWYFKRQKKKALLEQEKELELKNLENEKNVIALRNEKLRNDIEYRNKELAISTMAMIRKNEMLNELKDELNKLTNRQELKSVKKLLDRNLNSKQDWITFEEAFNNADKDFFKKIKEAHPNLTSGDLRLCVYLRMNLSSKEIAPLLNISPRSVEIKRYRLRKKIGLNREDSLTSYILEI